MPCKTKSRQTSRESVRTVHAMPPDTPRPPIFNYFFLKKSIFQFSGSFSGFLAPIGPVLAPIGPKRLGAADLKASPLPPAPPVTSSLVIWRIGGICRTGAGNESVHFRTVYQHPWAKNCRKTEKPKNQETLHKSGPGLIKMGFW